MPHFNTEWQKHTDASGRVYYHNRSTGESSWDNPFAATGNPIHQQASAGPAPAKQLGAQWDSAQLSELQGRLGALETARANGVELPRRGGPSPGNQRLLTSAAASQLGNRLEQLQAQRSSAASPGGPPQASEEDASAAYDGYGSSDPDDSDGDGQQPASGVTLFRVKGGRAQQQHLKGSGHRHRGHEHASSDDEAASDECSGGSSSGSSSGIDSDSASEDDYDDDDDELDDILGPLEDFVVPMVDEPVVVRSAGATDDALAPPGTPGGTPHHDPAALFVEVSLGCLKRGNPLRKLCIKLIANVWWDRSVLVLILVNALLMAMVDYGCVDAHNELATHCSQRNLVVKSTDKVFLSCFAIELVVKVIAMGFVATPGTYLRDVWNWLDFTVVVAGLLELLLPTVKMTALRVFRVLRPLRTLNRWESMRQLVVSLLVSLPALANVLLLMLCLFAIWGIFAVQLWGWRGAMHGRCRTTEAPIMLRSDAAAPLIPCLSPSEQSNSTRWTMSTSPWSTPRPCEWPVDPAQTRLCALPGSTGTYTCESGSWCGSNYDGFGQPRFSDLLVMNSALFIEELNWGMTGFDDIGSAVFTIFQCITLEGWSPIMYQVMDGFSWHIGAVYFCSLVVFGSLFLLNFILAVIYDAFSDENERLKKKQVLMDFGALDLDGDGFVTTAELRLVQVEKHPQALEIIAKMEQADMNGDGRMDIGEFKMMQPQGSRAARHAVKSPGGTLHRTRISTAALQSMHSLTERLSFFEKLKVIGQKRWAKLEPIVKHHNCDRAIVVAIGLNTLILCCDSWPMDDARENVLEVLNFVFTLIFLLEMALKLLGLGITRYLSDAFNAFDAFVCTVSLIELIYAPPPFLVGSSDASTATPVTALRTFRLFRVLKLMTKMPALRSLIVVIINMVRQVANFGMLLFLFVFIFSLLGMQLFANRYYFNPDTGRVLSIEQNKVGADHPRTNFDSFLNSFLLVFQILSGEDWNTLMYDARRVNSTMGMVYFCTVVIVGNFILLNLFVALLLGGFDGAAEEAGLENPVKPGALGEETKIKADTTLHGKSCFVLGPDNGFRKACAKIVFHPKFERVVLGMIILSSLSLAIEDPLGDPSGRQAHILAMCDIGMTSIFLIELLLKIVTLGLIVHRKAYLRDGWNQLDFLVVGISIIGVLNALSLMSGMPELKSLRVVRTLRATRPLRMISRFPGLKRVVNALIGAVPGVANVVIVLVLFFLIFAIMGVNMWKGKFRGCQGAGFEALSAAQLELVVRPVAYDNLSAAQKAWSSNHTYVAGTEAPNLWTSKSVCVWLGQSIQGVEWGPIISSNFNNVPRGMLTLLEMSTTEGWVDVMQSMVDSTSVDMQPIKDHYRPSAAFAVIFILTGSFFMMNLFIGVVIDTFNRLKTEVGDGKSIMLTNEQNEWLRMRKIMLRIRPQRSLPRPEAVGKLGKLRALCFDLAVKESRAKHIFDRSILACIIANTIVMASRHLGQSATASVSQEILNYLFASIFTCEAVIKVLGMGFRPYIKDGWNRFDFFIVIITNLGLIVMWTTGVSVGPIATAVRAGRIGRILRLFNRLKALRTLFDTFLLTLPSLGNISSLLLMLYFIYAVLGLQLFSKVPLDYDALDDHTNFRTLSSSFLTLVRASTGEGWNAIMHQLAQSPPGCDFQAEFDPKVCAFNGKQPGCTPINGCSKPMIVFAFFTTFVVITSFVFINLFVAVILEGFSDMSDIMGDDDGSKQSEADVKAGKFQMSEDEYSTFCEAWVTVDTDLDYVLDGAELYELVRMLDPPLGFGDRVAPPDVDDSVKLRVIALLDVRTLNSKKKKKRSLKVSPFSPVAAALCPGTQAFL